MGLGALAYVSLSAQPTSRSNAVIVVPQAPLFRAAPGSQNTAAMADHRGAMDRAAAPATLARSLQSRLAAAACYDGPISGQWGATSKEAMRRFVTAANARLPVDVPDAVLLAVLETSPHVKCSRIETATVIPVTMPAVGLALEAQTHERPMLSMVATPPLIRAPGDARQVTELQLTPAPRRAVIDAIAKPPVVSAPPHLSAPSIGVAESGLTGTGVNSAKPAMSGRNVGKVTDRNLRPVRRKPSAINDVSRSISRSVNSLQRSLAALLN